MRIGIIEMRPLAFDVESEVQFVLDLEERNVLFMPDGGQVYLKKMFERIM